MRRVAGFERKVAGHRVWAVAPEYERALRRLIEGGAVERALADTVRRGGRAGCAVLPMDGSDERVHLRPVRHGGLLAPLWGGRILGLGRPLAELEAAALLRQRGAPVPRPVLVLGQRRALLQAATMGTIYEEHTQDGVAFLEAEPSPTQLVCAARAAGEAVRRLHEAGGRHADLHLGNLLVRERPGSTEVVVVDLDRARVAGAPSPARRMAELMRLYRSLCKRGHRTSVGARPCAVFLGAYTAGDRPLRRAMRAAMARERLRLKLHALGYRGR